MREVRADVQMATSHNPRGLRFSPVSERGRTWVRCFQRGYDDCESLYLTPKSALRVVDEMTASGLILEHSASQPERPQKE